MPSAVIIRRIVCGKRYDTETARHLCHVRCPHYEDDFRWENTDLYVTKKGAYFLAGEGNAASRWGRHGFGMGVCPIGAEDARQFLEQEVETDLIEEFFEVEDA